MKARPVAPVRVSAETRAKLSRLVRQVSRDGWQAIGCRRTDRPTITAMVEEGVHRLIAKMS